MDKVSKKKEQDKRSHAHKYQGINGHIKSLLAYVVVNRKQGKVGLQDTENPLLLRVKMTGCGVTRMFIVNRLNICQLSISLFAFIYCQLLSGFQSIGRFHRVGMAGQAGDGTLINEVSDFPGFRGVENFPLFVEYCYLFYICSGTYARYCVLDSFSMEGKHVIVNAFFDKVRIRSGLSDGVIYKIIFS